MPLGILAAVSCLPVSSLLFPDQAGGICAAFVVGSLILAPCQRVYGESQ
ncbi:hypothetical protein J2W15_004192 [Pseudarthrobacter sulfonivorans]|jgi:hypothetical protein|nr:hypothetical protein [Pseudarthrobacter sulfonivorans]